MSELTGRVVLASASPRRRELLDAMGIRHEVIPSTVDESQIPADHPRTFAIRAAYAKALDVAARVEPGDLVIAADTVVTQRMMIFGKPRDRQDATRIIRQLSGSSHQVITAVAISRAGSAEMNLDSETTEVTFRALAEDDIRTYVLNQSIMDKAGAYGIQEDPGAQVVEQIKGDYFNVVGFPCALVARMLQDAGWPFPIKVPSTPARWRQV